MSPAGATPARARSDVPPLQGSTPRAQPPRGSRPGLVACGPSGLTEGAALRTDRPFAEPVHLVPARLAGVQGPAPAPPLQELHRAELQRDARGRVDERVDREAGPDDAVGEDRCPAAAPVGSPGARPDRRIKLI